MPTMETRSQNPMPDAMQANSGGNGIYPADPASLDSTAQRDNMNGGDWQEEVYQKIKAMKDLYLLDLHDTNQKIICKLQHHDSLPQQPKNELLEKLKVFKNMLERYMAFLQIPKQSILAGYKDKLGTYEKQIVSIINVNRHKRTTPQQQGQALPPPHMESQQTNSQSHENRMSLQMKTGNLQVSRSDYPKTEPVTYSDTNPPIPNDEVAKEIVALNPSTIDGMKRKRTLLLEEVRRLDKEIEKKQKLNDMFNKEK